MIWSFLGSSSWTRTSALISLRTIDWSHQYHKLPRSILMIFMFLAYSSHCSVDTELTDRENNAINCINCICQHWSVWTLSLSLYSSTVLWTMVSLHGRWDLHFLQISVACLPRYGPILLVDCSRKDTTYSLNLVQWKTIDQFQIFLQMSSQILHSLNIVLCCRICHRKWHWTLIWIGFFCERFWGLSQKAQEIADSIKKLQRCKSWEHVPLEFRRLSTDILQNLCSFSRLVLLQFCFSKLCCIQDVEELHRNITQNLKIRRLLCFEPIITTPLNQWQLCPRILLTQNFVPTINFFIIADRLCCDVKHLFQCKIFFILHNILHLWKTLSLECRCTMLDFLSHDELFKIGLFLDILWSGSPRSFVNSFFVPCRMRSPAEKMFSTMRVNFPQWIPRIFLRLPWSIVLSISTFPPLEETRIDHDPFVNSLIDVSTGCPVLSSRACLSGSWYPCEVLSGFAEAEEDTNEGVLAVKFIIGRDLAVTRPSPDSGWARFAIAAMQAVELKWLILNKVNKWFHSSRVKFAFVKMSANWFLVSRYLIWILGPRLIRSNNQSRATHHLQQLKKVSPPCTDDHHFKEEDTKSVGELSNACSQIILKCS